MSKIQQEPATTAYATAFSIVATYPVSSRCMRRPSVTTVRHFILASPSTFDPYVQPFIELVLIQMSKIQQEPATTAYATAFSIAATYLVSSRCMQRPPVTTVCCSISPLMFDPHIQPFVELVSIRASKILQEPATTTCAIAFRNVATCPVLSQWARRPWVITVCHPTSFLRPNV